MTDSPVRNCRLALVQSRAHDDPHRNLTRALDAIGEAAAGGADVVVLQELFRSRYFCQAENSAAFELAEPIPGPTTEALSARARELGVVLVGSVFERREAGVYHNTALVWERDGSLVCRYRKMHIPDDPCFEEKYFFTPGDARPGGGFVCAPTSAARIGPLVCWDQWYPEAARLTALRGAQILVYPTAIGWLANEKEELGATQVDAWMTMQRSHAIANGVFVAAVNRVGVEDSIEFWGSSFVCDPLGRVIARASHDEEEILYADCDLDVIESTRRDWPFLRDRRIDAYAGLDQRLLDDSRDGVSADGES